MTKTLIAALAGSALLATAAPAQAIAPGTYRGQTDQGASIKIVVKGALGPGVRIERIKLAADLECPDGSVDDVSLDRLVIGGKVKKDGRFRLRMADLDLSGRFVSKKRVTGSFDVSDFSCAAEDITYSARKT
jgi:hypothetical protein